MAPLMKSVLLLLTLVIATPKGSKSWKVFPPIVRVQIINNVSSPQDLTLHCKSKTDDLAEHTIRFGEKYEFRFRPNPFFAISLYFCSFRWPSDPSLHYFDIYVEIRDQWCDVCSWKIFEHGACIFDVISHFTRCYPWNSEPQSTPLAPLAVATSNVNTTQSHF